MSVVNCVSNTVRKASILILQSPVNLTNLSGSNACAMTGNVCGLRCGTCVSTGYACIGGCVCGNGNGISVSDTALVRLPSIEVLDMLYRLGEMLL